MKNWLTNIARKYTTQCDFGVAFLAAGSVVFLALFVSPLVNKLPDHPPQTNITPPVRTVDYVREVRPILDRRCVVCHACYDAPCQLKLSSMEGIARGASKTPVYNTSRLKAVAPTRLYIDATSTSQWRTKGFFPITESKTKANQQSSSDSVLLRILRHGRAHPFAKNSKLPKQVKLDIWRELSCPDSAEIDKYTKEFPHGGMPYAMAALSDKEYQVLHSWAVNGSFENGDTPTKIALPVQKEIEKWESLLNGPSAKQRLAARYIYEHLFLAHLVFEELAPSQYFRLVRSRTPLGQPIEEIATRHPHSSPGDAPFYYRLRLLKTSIVHKTHLVYPLSKTKRLRIKELFFNTQWDVGTLPGYESKTASNPFVTFAAIPARSRYLFLLDNARFFVMTFIRGPACRGQAALNVIDDHFFLAFLDPEYDLSVSDPEFLQTAKTLIEIPLDSSSPLTLLQRWKGYYASHRRYLRFREDSYFQKDPKGERVSLDSLWSGNQYNKQSFLTVFRHFDSASVIPGFIGEVPKTFLILDYPILERMYYNLVPNFDVFGNITHQLLTRLSMDYLRMEAEDIALGFFPPESREEIRNSWYRGASAQLVLYLAHKRSERERGTAIDFKTKTPKVELIENMITRFDQLKNQPDTLNRCAQGQCRPRPSQMTLETQEQLRKIASQRGEYIRFLPDLSYLRIKSGNNEKNDQMVTIIRNKAHTNVAFIFGEERRRVPEEDTLTLVSGFVGSYPNFFFEAEAANIAAFIKDLKALKTAEDFNHFVENYGIRRTSPKFWETADWFADHMYEILPKEAGILDLNRYRNY